MGDAVPLYASLAWNTVFEDRRASSVFKGTLLTFRPGAKPLSEDFKVTALIAAFNEEDIVGAVIGDLIAQGAQVYLLDHESTDGTVEAAKPYLGHGLLEIERFATSPDGPHRYHW